MEKVTATDIIDFIVTHMNDGEYKTDVAESVAWLLQNGAESDEERIQNLIDEAWDQLTTDLMGEPRPDPMRIWNWNDLEIARRLCQISNLEMGMAESLIHVRKLVSPVPIA